MSNFKIFYQKSNFYYCYLASCTKNKTMYKWVFYKLKMHMLSKPKMLLCHTFIYLFISKRIKLTGVRSYVIERCFPFSDKRSTKIFQKTLSNLAKGKKNSQEKGEKLVTWQKLPVNWLVIYLLWKKKETLFLLQITRIVHLQILWLYV